MSDRGFRTRLRPRLPIPKSEFRNPKSSGPVVPDRLDGTRVHRLMALRALLGALRLPEHVRVALRLAALEVLGRRDPADVAVDALRVHVVLSGHVLRDPVSWVRHAAGEVSTGPRAPQMNGASRSPGAARAAV